MPSSYNKKEAERRLQTASNVGSFWLDRLQQKGQALDLIEACSKVRLLNQFSIAANQLLGEDELTVENIRHPIDLRKVSYSGNLRFDTGLTYDNFAKSSSEHDGGNTGIWIVPLEKVPLDKGLSPEIHYSVVPISITMGGELLIRNIDFVSKGDRLYLYHSPYKLLKDQDYFTITTGSCRRKSIYRHVYNQDIVYKNKYLADFIRNKQSAVAFHLAAASIADLKILEEGQFLKKVIHHRDTIEYTFENEVFHVGYKHEPLTEGKYYPKSYIIGEGIRITTPGKTDSNWWRSVDFKGGLAMAPLTGDKSLLIPDNLVTAYVADVGETFAGKTGYHTRLELIGDPDEQDLYWDGVQRREKLVKKYLDDIVEIDKTDYTDSEMSNVFNSLKESLDTINRLNIKQGRPKEYRNVKRLQTAKKYVNALDVFFKGILGQKVFVVELDAEVLGDKTRAVTNFIIREHPSGCLPLILINGYSQSEEIRVNEVFKDSITVSVTEEHSSQEELSLGSIIVDTFELKKDTVT